MTCTDEDFGKGRAVKAGQLVALVRAGATFTGGELVERPGEGRDRAIA